MHAAELLQLRAGIVSFGRTHPTRRMDPLDVLRTNCLSQPRLDKSLRKRPGILQNTGSRTAYTGYTGTSERDPDVCHIDEDRVSTLGGYPQRRLPLYLTHLKIGSC